MIAHGCNHQWKGNGKDRKGRQRWRCKRCGITRSEETPKPLGTLHTSIDKAEMAIRMLCEGLSVRSTSRLTNLDKNTVLRIIVTAGRNIQRFCDRTLRNLPVNHVTCDEIWGFVYAKDRTCKHKGFGEERGSTYCFTALDAETKMYLCWEFGRRTNETTTRFMGRLRDATDGRFQLSTDGLEAFYQSVVSTFGDTLDYARIVKIFGRAKGNHSETRYSPGSIQGITKTWVTGYPDMRKANTCYSERGNLNIRMACRRMTRLTNAFSKKQENHEAALAMFFGFHNWCRPHLTLKTTPAVAAGLTDHTWTVRELLENAASPADPAPRTPKPQPPTDDFPRMNGDRSDRI